MDMREIWVLCKYCCLLGGIRTCGTLYIYAHTLPMRTRSSALQVLKRPKRQIHPVIVVTMQYHIYFRISLWFFEITPAIRRTPSRISSDILST